MKRIASFATLCILLIPVAAFAWGGDGHQIICLIAEDHLTPAAKAGIKALLGDANISDGDVASWADNVRRERPETGPWHYVDIPTDANGFDEKRDGQDGNNVVDKVSAFKAILADPKTPRDARVEALKFLVHFVGDMHQPLHCAERNHDKGGNMRLVFFLAQPRAVNLHTCWDSLILLNHKGNVRDADYAEKLNAEITPEDEAEWVKGTPTDWANQSHDLAVSAVYKGVPPDGPPPKLNQAYVDASAKVIDLQFQRAGIRLAMILNEVFK